MEGDPGEVSLNEKSKDLGVLNLSLIDLACCVAAGAESELMTPMLMRWKEGQRICLQLRRKRDITEELCRGSFLNLPFDLRMSLL